MNDIYGAVGVLLLAVGLYTLIKRIWDVFPARPARRRYKAARLDPTEYRIFVRGVVERRGYGIPARVGGRKAS